LCVVFKNHKKIKLKFLSIFMVQLIISLYLFFLSQSGLSSLLEQ
jgi:hypothetical protein